MSARPTSGKGSNPDFLLGGRRPLPPSADIGPGGQSVGQAAQFCLAGAVLLSQGLPAAALSVCARNVVAQTEFGETERATAPASVHAISAP